MRSRKTRTQEIESDDSNTMMPVMSLMIVLIPFLVGNVAFLQLEAIEVHSPGLGQSEAAIAKKLRSYITQLSVKTDQYSLELMDEETGATVRTEHSSTGKAGRSSMMGALQAFRQEYPKMNTILVSVDSAVTYREVTKVFEKLRMLNHDVAEKAKVNIVLLPKEMLQ